MFIQYRWSPKAATSYLCSLFKNPAHYKAMMKHKRARCENEEQKQVKRPRSELQLQVPWMDSAELIETGAQYLATDPVLLDSVQRWNDHWVLIPTFQNSGKTYFTITALLRTFTPGDRIVFTAPFNATLRDIKSVIEKHCDFIPGTKIALHTDTKRTHHNDWEILLCHPRSLHGFDLRRCNAFVVDELTANVQQMLSWDESAASVLSSINAAKQAQHQLLKVAERVIILGAQTTEKELRAFCELTNVNPKPFLRYKSTYVDALHPKSIVRLMGTENQFTHDAWNGYLNGERMSLNFGTARKAEMYKEYFDRKIAILRSEQPEFRIHGRVPCADDVLLFTAQQVERAFGSAVPEDLTNWLVQNNVNIILATNALPPGVSINNPHYWSSRRLYLSSNTPSSIATQGQCVNRIRMPADLDIYTFIEHRQHRVKPVDIVRKLKRTADSSITRSICELSGHLIDTLADDLSTEIRRELLAEKYITDRMELANLLASKLDNGEVVIHPQQDDYPTCQVWTHLEHDYNTRGQSIRFLTQQEVDNEEASISSVSRALMPKHIQLAKDVHRIVRWIQPSLVHPKFRNLNLGFNHAAFSKLVPQTGTLLTFKLFTVTSVGAFNSTLHTRITAYECNNPKRDKVDLMKRIFPGEVAFLLTRLLLDVPEILQQLDAYTLCLLRSDFTLDRYEYLRGTYADLQTFIRFHRAFITGFYTKNYRKEFKTNLEIGNESALMDPKFLMKLFRIVLTQAGLGLSKTRIEDGHSTKHRHYRVTSLKLWSELGCNLDDLVRSIAQPTQFQDYIAQCACEGIQCQTGEPTECVRQGGKWLCIAPQSIGLQPCRDLFLPLDTTMNKIDLPYASMSHADKLLQILGFEGGLESKLVLSKQEIERKYDHDAVLWRSFLVIVDDKVGTDFVAQMGKKSKVSKLVDALNKALKEHGRSVERKQMQCKGIRVWIYSLL